MPCYSVIWICGNQLRLYVGYWKIEEYAKHLGAQIINASSITYIDVFKRKPLAEVLIELENDARNMGDGPLIRFC